MKASQMSNLTPYQQNLLQAYNDEYQALIEAHNQYLERLAEHTAEALQTPNLKSMGQLIVARKKIKEALNALNSI